MTTITFTATAPDGTENTRTSGTMPYTHAVMVNNPADGKGWGTWSWHKSPQAARKAASDGWLVAHYPERAVVEAIPTAVNGKVERGQFADWPNAQRIAELIEAKLAGKRKAAPVKDRLASARTKYDSLSSQPAEQEPAERLLNTDYPMDLAKGTINGRPVPSGYMAEAQLARELVERGQFADWPADRRPWVTALANHREAEHPALDVKAWRALIAAIRSGLPLNVTSRDAVFGTVKRTVIVEYAYISPVGQSRLRIAYWGFTHDLPLSEVVEVEVPSQVYPEQESAG